MAVSDNPDASYWTLACALMWDTAETIDPIFLTDLIAYMTGLSDAYADDPESESKSKHEPQISPPREVLYKVYDTSSSGDGFTVTVPPTPSK
jgi:hypothetical protein